jgi:hypothetical protein
MDKQEHFFPDGARCSSFKQPAATLLDVRLYLENMLEEGVA